MNENELRRNQVYEYYSPTRNKKMPVKYDTKRGPTFIFRRVDTLDEIWVQNLNNIEVQEDTK